MSQEIIKHVKDMVAEANQKIETMSVEQAQNLLDDEGYIFVDIRDIRELKRDGKIRGAFHAPRGMLEFWVDPQSPYHKEIFSQEKKFVFYCGSAWRSALATLAVQEMGLKPVCHIEGGFSNWKASGGDIEEI